MAKRTELPDGLLRALATTPVGVDSRELLESLVRVWGGPDQLALSIHQEYQNAPQGGMTRQRILEMLQRLVITNTERDLTNKVRAVDMSTEDLQSFAENYIQRLMKQDAEKKH